MTQITVQPIFGSYAIVAVAVGILIATLGVTPNFASTSRRRNQVLRTLRVGTILCLVMAMLRPALVHTSVHRETSTIAILLDASRSMSVRDVDERTRWEAMRKTLSDGLARRKVANNPQVTLQAYLFSESARIAPAQGKEWVLPNTPSGNQTDLGGALDGMLRAYATSPLAAIVLLSDGAQRTLQSSIPLAQPARELARRGVPLYTILFGRTREQSQTKDIAVEQLPDAFETFVKNEIVVRGTLRVQGFANRDLSARMMVERPDGEKDFVGPVGFKTKGDLEQVTVEFPYAPQAPGEYRLTLEAPPQAGEQLRDNNQLQAFLDVRDGGLRVLFVDGNLAWQEQKFIRRAVDGAPELDLDYVWLDQRRSDKWPLNLAALFARQEYDVVVLSNVHAKALSNGRKPVEGSAAEEDSLVFLAERVNQGMGLMMTGGANSFGGGGFGGTPLAELLQVRMSPSDERDFKSQTPPDAAMHVMGEIPMLVTMPHFVTQLSDRGENLWSTLPPLMGANRLLANKTGLVLLQSPDEHPLLIAGQFGSGRVLSFAGDSTFRWYRRGLIEPHQRFWRQAILWLARKEATQDEMAWIRLARRRIVHGGKAEFEAGFRSMRVPSNELRLEASLLLPGGQQVPVSLPSMRDNAVKGSTESLTQPGEYRLRIHAYRGTEDLGQAEAGFWIVRQDLELADSAANPEQLAYLSSLTEDAGGALIAPEQLAETLDRITSNRQANRTEIQSRWQLTDTPYDAWALFAVMMVLLSLEWYWRRRWSMM